MLRSKILKTKKRLSDEKHLYRTIAIAVAFVFVCVGFCFRASSFSSPYGYIGMEIPVSKAKDVSPSAQHDGATAHDREAFHDDGGPVVNRQVTGSTPLLILTDQKFLFGDVSAFTTNLSDVANKISIPHQDGAPRLGKLIAAIQNRTADKEDSDVLFMLPEKNIPVAIVIKVIAGIKENTRYKRVILASGLM
jgi:hypothetical protein